MTENDATSHRKEPPVPKMTLREYAEFSLECLKNNPTITPENCMHKRTDEAIMQAFRLKTKDYLPPKKHSQSFFLSPFYCRHTLFPGKLKELMLAYSATI